MWVKLSRRLNLDAIFDYPTAVYIKCVATLKPSHNTHKNSFSLCLCDPTVIGRKLICRLRTKAWNISCPFDDQQTPATSHNIGISCSFCLSSFPVISTNIEIWSSKNQ